MDYLYHMIPLLSLWPMHMWPKTCTFMNIITNLCGVGCVEYWFRKFMCMIHLILTVLMHYYFILQINWKSGKWHNLHNMRQLVSDRGRFKNLHILILPSDWLAVPQNVKSVLWILRSWVFYSYSFHLCILLFLWWAFIILLFLHFLLNLLLKKFQI